MSSQRDASGNVGYLLQFVDISDLSDRWQYPYLVRLPNGQYSKAASLQHGLRIASSIYPSPGEPQYADEYSAAIRKINEQIQAANLQSTWPHSFEPAAPPPNPPRPVVRDEHVRKGRKPPLG